MAGEGKAAAEAWVWEPLVRLGPIRFGDSVEVVRKALRLVETSTNADADGVWTWYDVTDSDVSVLTLNGAVISANCQNLSYRGICLDGLTEDQVKETLAPHEVRRGSYPRDTTLFVDSLECMITLDEQSGTVSAISVASHMDD